MLPYVSQRGSWFNRVGGAHTDAEVLDTHAVARRSTHLTCEAFNRPGRWISMLSGTVRAAATELTKRVESPAPGLSHATGFEQVSAYFKSAEGQKTLQACKILDFGGSKGGRSEHEIQQALQVLLKFMYQKSLVTAIKRIALFTSQQYVMAMNLVEAHSILNNRQHWANELSQQLDQHPREMRRFVLRYESDDALFQGLSASLLQVMREQAQREGGQTTLEDMGEDGDGRDFLRGGGRDSFDRGLEDDGLDSGHEDEARDNPSGRAFSFSSPSRRGGQAASSGDFSLSGADQRPEKTLAARSDAFSLREASPENPLRTSRKAGTSKVFSLSGASGSKRAAAAAEHKDVFDTPIKGKRLRSGEHAADALQSCVLGLQEEEESDDEGLYREHWSSPKVSASAEALKTFQESPSLEKLKALANSVPEKVLDKVGLGDLVTRLSGFKRMPRAASIDTILATLKKVVDRAVELQASTVVVVGQPPVEDRASVPGSAVVESCAAAVDDDSSPAPATQPPDDDRNEANVGSGSQIF